MSSGVGVNLKYKATFISQQSRYVQHDELIFIEDIRDPHYTYILSLARYLSSESLFILGPSSFHETRIFTTDNHKRAFDNLNPGSVSFEWIVNPQVVTYRRYPQQLMSASD